MPRAPVHRAGGAARELTAPIPLYPICAVVRLVAIRVARDPGATASARQRVRPARRTPRLLLIHCGENEMLLDDSVRLAERAKAAGVDVTLKVYPGLWHVFHRFGFVPEARSAVTEIGAFARTRLGPPTAAAV